MGVGAGLSMYVVVVQKFTFAISSPDEFLLNWSVCGKVMGKKVFLARACPVRPLTVLLKDELV